MHVIMQRLTVRKKSASAFDSERENFSRCMYVVALFLGAQDKSARGAHG
jgi:hypothetical protein